MSEHTGESIATAKALCKMYMAKKIPAYLHGPPGVGKSDAWAQLAKEANIGFIDLRLGMMDPVDLLGLPAHHNGETIWAKPAFWPQPKRDGERGIILFDELSDCSRAMQSVAYQIILNGRAGPHEIPNGWYRCAAGNRREDRAAAQSLSSALANRFAHISIVPNIDAFCSWALTTDYMGHLVPGFLKYRPNLLHDMKGENLLAFPTPRSWAQVARVVEDAPDEYKAKLIQGLVGAGPAGEFMTFLKACNLPSFKEVTENPKKVRVPKEPANKYAMSVMLARYVTKDTFPQVMTYITREEFGRDFEICTVMDATNRDHALCNTKSYSDFANRNQDMAQ